MDWQKANSFEKLIGNHINNGIANETLAVRILDRVKRTMTAEKKWPVSSGAANASFISAAIAKAFGRPCLRVLFHSRNQPVSDWPIWTDVDQREVFDGLAERALDNVSLQDEFLTAFHKTVSSRCPHCHQDLESRLETELVSVYPRKDGSGKLARTNRETAVTWWTLLHCRGYPALADRLEPLVDVYERVAPLGELLKFSQGTWLVQVA